MRAVVITKHGGPGVLQVQERPDPTPGPGPGADRRGRCGDQLRRRDGAHGPLPGRPEDAVRRRLRGRRHDPAAGGGRRRASSVGQRVLAGTMFGGYASQVVATAADVVALPDELSFEQGAAIPVNYGDRVGGPDRLRQPAAGRARADPLRRRRRRHRGHADRQARRRRGLRDGLARQARPLSRAGRRSHARLHQARLGAGPAEVRRDHGRGRRRELPPQLQPAAARRPPGRVRRLRRSSRASAKTSSPRCARSRACRAST